MSGPVSSLTLDVIAPTPAPAWFAAWPLAEKIAARRAHALKGISIVLTPYERRHGDALRALRNQPHNRINLAQTGELTAGNQRAWEDGYFARTNDVNWIVLTPAHEFAGAVALYDITATEGETGRLVLREDIARSSPAIAECELMIQWLAFTWLGLRRVLARIQPDNTKMVAMHERLGFVAVGPSEIRGIPYVQFEATAENFNLGPHLKVLQHWRARAPAAR